MGKSGIKSQYSTNFRNSSTDAFCVLEFPKYKFIQFEWNVVNSNMLMVANTVKWMNNWLLNPLNGTILVKRASENTKLV